MQEGVKFFTVQDTRLGPVKDLLAPAWHHTIRDLLAFAIMKRPSAQLPFGYW